MQETGIFPAAPAVERLARAVAMVRRARTVAEVYTSVPRAVVELGFERVMISAVDDGYWRPQAVQIASDHSWSARVLDTAMRMPQPIDSTAPERRVIERASPIVVPAPRDVHQWSKETWDFRHPSRTTAYIASPIITGGRVAGIIHADRGTSCRSVNGAHASLLWTFCGIVELALAATEAEDHLTQMRSHLAQMASIATKGTTSTRGCESGSLALRGSTPPPVPVADLTDRERDILELVARGISNAQIGEQLTLAENTVKTHVRHMLAKTHSPNRTAAALRWTKGEIV